MLMIFLLLVIIRSERGLTWNWIENSSTSSFDIKYNGISTTYFDQGWFVVFRIVYTSVVSKLIYVSGENHGKASFDGINFEIRPEIDPETHYLVISFKLNNTGTEPKRVDIGVFANARQFDYYSSFHFLGGQRGFTIKSENTKLTYTLLIRHAPRTTNVDTFYYASLFNEWTERKRDGTVRYIPDKLPYFRNETREIQRNDYNCFAFSWTRDIYPGQSIDLSTSVGMGPNLKIPPFVYITGFKETYQPNELFSFTLTFGEYDNNETVIYSIKDSNGIATEKSFHTVQSDMIITHYFLGSVGQGHIYWFSVSGVDSHGCKSNVINKTLYVTKKPELYIPKKIIERYKSGRTIDLEGDVFDDGKVKLKYMFDNRFALDVDGKEYHCNDRTISFKTQIIIPKWIEYGQHILHLFAQDEFGIESHRSTYWIYFSPHHSPELQNVTLSSSRLRPSETVRIKGKVKDANIGDNITIHAIIGNINYCIANKTSDGNWMEFTGSLVIPQDLHPGKHHLYLQAINQDELSSKNEFNSIVDIEIYLPGKHIWIYVAITAIIVAVVSVIIVLYIIFIYKRKDKSAVELQETTTRSGGQAAMFRNQPYSANESQNDETSKNDFEETYLKYNDVYI